MTRHVQGTHSVQVIVAYKVTRRCLKVPGVRRKHSAEMTLLSQGERIVERRRRLYGEDQASFVFAQRPLSLLQTL